MVRRSGSDESDRALRVEAGERGAEVAKILRGLRPGALYELRVEVFTRFGSAPAGGTITARTPPEGALPGVRRELSNGRTKTETNQCLFLSDAEGVVLRAHHHSARGGTRTPALRRRGSAATAAPLGAVASKAQLRSRRRRLAAAG